MGHLDQTRQGQATTKMRPQYSRDLYLGLIDTQISSPSVPHRPGTIYSDPTGRFITKSSQDNQYILVVYDADSNYIFAEPLPSRSAQQIVSAYDKIQSLLISRGITPYLHILDNEVSTLLKEYITSKGIKYQMVPPNQHRANAAERAIRTFQNHFIAILCSCDPAFPLHLWDRLIEQAVITLNLVRTSTINNRLSAYAQVHGAYNFTNTPLGPPGTKVIAHEKPVQRGTWSPHGVEGWYVGPAMEHYRNFIVYIPSTRTTRIADTLAWFPSKVIMPTASSTEIAIPIESSTVCSHKLRFLGFHYHKFHHHSHCNGLMKFHTNPIASSTHHLHKRRFLGFHYHKFHLHLQYYHYLQKW